MASDQDYVDAGRAVFAKWLSDEVAALVKDARAVAEPTLVPGERRPALLPDGTEIGALTRSKPKPRATVTDPVALLDWVRERHPEELTQHVNSAFQEWLLKQVGRDGVCRDRDGAEVPGIGVTTGNPSYIPKVDPDADALIRERLAELIGNGLFAPPAIESSEQKEPS